MKNFRIHFTKVYQDGEFPNSAVIPARGPKSAEARLRCLVKKANETFPDVIIHSIEVMKE